MLDLLEINDYILGVFFFNLFIYYKYNKILTYNIYFMMITFYYHDKIQIIFYLYFVKTLLIGFT